MTYMLHKCFIFNFNRASIILINWLFQSSLLEEYFQVIGLAQFLIQLVIWTMERITNKINQSQLGNLKHLLIAQVIGHSFGPGGQQIESSDNAENHYLLRIPDAILLQSGLDHATIGRHPG